MFNERHNPRPKARGIHHANIKDKPKTEKRLRAAFCKTRVELTVDGTNEPIKATIVLAELGKKGTFLFAQTKLRKKSRVTFKLMEPLEMTLNATVRFCEPLYSVNAAQTTRHSRYYRIYIQFTFHSDAEQLALQDLYLKIRDESYAATQWHNYVHELAQRKLKSQWGTIKMLEKIKAAQDEPVLATDEMLVANPEGVRKSA